MHTNGDNHELHKRPEGHDMGKEALGSATPQSQGPKFDTDHPGYEVEDVNVRGIAVFLAGLFGTVIIFFFVCWALGKEFNSLLEKQDGPPNKWTLARNGGAPGKPENLKSNAAMEQQELTQMTNAFPAPRLEIDDGNQETADLHAREDLLLEHYSLVQGQPGTVRIPIERAMQLIAQNPGQYGLTVETPPNVTPDNVAHAAPPQIRIPLTNGFARTGYELMTIEAREQKMNYGKAVNAEMVPEK